MILVWRKKQPALVFTWIGNERTNLALPVTPNTEYIAAVIGPRGPAGAEGSGWGFYKHTGSAQSISANTNTILLNNAGTTIESQKPSDVTTFFSANKITGRSGDAITAQIDFIFTPTNSDSSMLDVWIDIGGGFPPAFRREFSIIRGSGLPHSISFSIAPYTLNTWQANGGAIMIFSDGPGLITEQSIVITRTHKAR